MMYGIRRRIGDDDRLFIIAGGQRGAAINLEDVPLTLGSHADNDILLLGDEVGETELTVKPHSDQLVEVSVVGGSAQVGGRKLKDGASRLAGRTVSIILGDVELMIARSLGETDGVRRRRERRASRLGWAASIAVVVVTSGAVALSGGMGAMTPPSAPQATSSGRTGAIVPMLASTALEGRLADHQLSDLTVTADRDAHVIVVEGGLRPSEADDWDSVQKWFDATYGATVQLEARLTAENEAVTLPFGVQSIWMSPYPRLTLHDGSQSRVGDILPGGWHLDAIKASGVEISRNGERLTLSL